MNAPIKTSITDPIRVDFVPSDKFGLKGQLGLTFAPGKFRMNGWTASWQRDLETDLIRLRDHYGCQVLVSLIEKFEVDQLKIPTLRERAEELGIYSIWFPIVDGSIPTDLENFARTITEIRNLVDSGRTVVIHCMGGLGRAGLVSSCVLVSKGILPNEAVKEVRQARPGAIETLEQEEFVNSFYKSLSNR